MKQKKVNEVKEFVGVRFTLDKSLDKYSGIDLFPEKTKKAKEILSKTNIKFK